jgi:hypothetical protein
MPVSNRIRALLLQGLFFALAAAAAPAHATHALCRAENGGERIALDVPASPDPFVFHTAEFGQRFRVSAQYLQPAGKLKTFVYDFRGDTAALIHAGEYRLGDADCSAHAAGFGLNKIYSRNYEREIFLQCFAVCD